MKIKILATEAGFQQRQRRERAVGATLPEGCHPGSAPILSDPNIRVGKTALWVRLPADFETWSQLLVDILTQSSGSPSG